MDMDFLSDPIFSELGRSDYIGGIDNEALDFGQLDQFMQVAATVGHIDETNNSSNSRTTHHNTTNTTTTNNHNNGNNNNINNNTNSLICDPKTESPATPPNAANDAHLVTAIATVSARVSLTSTPIPTPLSVGANTLPSVAAHLPESPPDSGSEPPYSPIQDVNGLTLTTRDIYQHGLSTTLEQHQQHHHHQLQQQQQLHELQLQQQQQQQQQLHQVQFTPPHNQHHFTHNLQNHLNASTPLSPLSALSTTTPTQEHIGGIRVKHESGLIMNPGILAIQQQQQPQQHNLQQQQHPQMPNNGLHVLQPQHQQQQQQQQQQLLYAPHTHATGLLPQYDTAVVVPASAHQHSPLYAAVSYPDITALNNTSETTASCMLSTSISDAARVQVVGTTQASHSQLTRTSAPSTPVHMSSSRKRKMSTQLDCPDYTSIKPDPGLLMSPVSGTPQHTTIAMETQKLDPTSPVSISLPPHGHDMSHTPAHSSASLSPALSTVNSNADNSLECSSSAGGGSNNDNACGNSTNGDANDANALSPCIRFSPFQTQNWHKLCDQSLQDIAVIFYRVDADKGFNFSVSDDAFVCQKKNHFQITCHARLQGEAKFVKTPSGLEKIKSFHLHFYGVKLEAPNQTIRVEQSQSDRSKKPFHPVPIDLQSHIVSKVTVGRLHFSETTNNNMRKKGRPNPEQRYFQLVVGLHVHTMSGNFPVISQGSERIIVRASNPGQFESDVDLCWQRGLTQDSIYHAGRVGINTDRPDESLVVHGNLKVSGHIVQPSDSRAKQEIAELDTSVQLRNLQKIRIVRYRYEPEFAIHSGLKRASESDSEEIVDTGVIAQEVREVIPDAVQEAGSIVLPNGNVIENFLLVNKDRILMENIGAVKELCKVTGSLETRIEHLERMNSRLVRAKECEKKVLPCRSMKRDMLKDGYDICSNKLLQIIIILLIIIMATCLTAVSTLYFVEHNSLHHNRNQLEQTFSNGPYAQHDNPMIEYERRVLHNIRNKTQNHWSKTLFPSTTTRPHSRSRGNNNKTRTELTYKEEAHDLLNDNVTVVMEKPIVELHGLKEPYKMTTTSPLLRNKTISNKSKIKWTLPLAVHELQLQNAANRASASVGVDVAVVPDAATVDNAIPTVEQPQQDEPAAVLARTLVSGNETSSEKVPDTIPLPQDFENNSIDIDAQHIAKKPAPVLSKSTSGRLGLPALNDASLLIASNDGEVTFKLVEAIVSTSSSNSFISIPDTTASARNQKPSNADPSRSYEQYHTVLPPLENAAAAAAAATDNNYSLEAPAISNKSQGVLERSDSHTVDALDLQNLSGNNESIDNPIKALFNFELNNGARESSLGRRSTSQRSVEWVNRRTIPVSVLGLPTHCTEQQPQSAQVSNCQSVCFEDTNQLSPLRTLSLSDDTSIPIKIINISQQQHVDPDDTETEDADADDELEEIQPVPSSPNGSTNPNTNASQISANSQVGKTSHPTNARSKQFSAEQRHADDTDALDTELDHSISDEHLDADDKPKLNFDKNSAHAPNLSIEVQRPPALECWKISSTAIADGLNQTFGQEEFCNNIGKSLNLTYVVPLSRYFKEQNMEIHISSSTPLVWTICNNHEHSKQDGKHLIHTPILAHQQPSTQQQQQQQQLLKQEPQQPIQQSQQQQQQQQPQYHVNQLQRHDNTSILFINMPSLGYFVKDFALRATNDFEKENICDDIVGDETADVATHETNVLLQYNFRILRDCD